MSSVASRVVVLCFLLISLIPSVVLASISPNVELDIFRADQDFRGRAVEERARSALKTYLELAEKTEAKDPDVLWRVSMGSYFVGLHLDQRLQRESPDLRAGT